MEDRPKSSRFFVRGLAVMGLTLVCLVAISLVMEFLGADAKISGLFYDAQGGWSLYAKQPWISLYKFGTIPGLLLGLGALGVWIFSLSYPRIAPWRRYALLVLLTIVVGGGIVVNGFLKPYWGRPRPVQTQIFDGAWEYRSPLSPGVPGRGTSFPCGHCTMGFVFVSLWFVRRKSPAIAWAGLCGGLVWGGFLSAARVVQGAHFTSDALWSLGVILLSAQGLYYFVLRIPAHEEQGAKPPGIPAAVQSGPEDADSTDKSLSAKKTPGKRRLVIAFVILAGLMTLFFLTRRPVYEALHVPIYLVTGTEKLILVTNVEPSRVTVSYLPIELARLRFESQGFGLPFSKWITHLFVKDYNKTREYWVLMETRGYFSEMDHFIVIQMPQALKDVTSVEMRIEPDAVFPQKP
ncbi:MAG: phosphatase PAP2 family protein [Desulfatibacillaceae bacterium]|nr:phosphatase PAP2 family protein [Desulfatibacillaceae bacterium]